MPLPSDTAQRADNLVLTWLHSQIARDLAQRESTVWQEMFGRYLTHGLDNIDEIFASLNKWALELVPYHLNVFPYKSSTISYLYNIVVSSRRYRAMCPFPWLLVS